MVKIKTLYLAGPDVFHRDPVALGAEKKRLCAQYGFEGLYPLDKEVAEGPPEQMRAAIYAGNIALMRRADAYLANMTPFKGVDADPGTAFEVGFAAALGKPIYLYSASDETIFERDKALAAAPGALARWLRAEAYTSEAFENGVNLMMLEACRESGGAFVQSGSGVAEDLALFEAALQRLRADQDAGGA